MTTTPRARVRQLFQELMIDLRERPRLLLDASVVRLIREFGIACYELGLQDRVEGSTLPAPKREDHEPVTGAYSLQDPDKEDVL
jgi:hypothetical protein